MTSTRLNVKIEAEPAAATTASARPLKKARIQITGTGPDTRIQIRDTRGRRIQVIYSEPGESKDAYEYVPCGPLGTAMVTVKGAPAQASQTIPLRINADTSLETGSGNLDHLVPRIRFFLSNDTTTYYINGRVVHGYRSPDTSPIWLRDHTHQMKGFKYFDPEVISAIDYFLQEQREDGSLWDYVVMGGEDDAPFGKRVPRHARCEVEADVEYLGVNSAFLAWQCTGDTAWVASVLPQLERAVHYSMNDPWRWSAEHGLIKRPYTVDTWDYEYENCDPWTEGNTHLGLMHGDNSGLYRALCEMSILESLCGNNEKADQYNQEARALRERANRLLWNGRFYTHWVPINPIEVPGIDVREQLSLSNPYDINRGLPTHRMAVSIIREYQRRLVAQRDNSFAEWHSIDPPFPSGSFQKNEHSWTRWAGEYTNGGILPLVGGELARGAFEHGEEYYGVDILDRYSSMVAESGETYLWYHRDGRPGKSSASTLPTDGWGSAAMLHALMEGLAGIVDQGCLFNPVTLSPRWAAADEREVYAVARYAASSAYAAYTYTADTAWNEINMALSGSGEVVRVRVLLPERKGVRSVTVDGKAKPFRIEKVENSCYCTLKTRNNTKVRLELTNV